MKNKGKPKQLTNKSLATSNKELKKVNLPLKRSKAIIETGNLSIIPSKKSVQNFSSTQTGFKSELSDLNKADLNDERNALKQTITDSDRNPGKSNIVPQINKDSINANQTMPSHIQEEFKIDLNVPDIKAPVNTDNIKVVARFRPLNSVETDLCNRGMGGICVKYNKREGCTVTNSVGFAQSFTLDRVFDSNTTQKQLFDEVAKPTIQEILKGYNGTIFTYGQSGSGKTHTMYGSSLYDDEQKGIIPRSIEYIFDFINDSMNESIKFQIKFSMLEIYKESLYDLLNPEIDSRDLKIKETKDKQIYVKNLTEEYITNIEDFLLLIDQADQYRVVSETGLNKQSSRSHLLFIIEILQQLPDGSEKCGKLNLIDLAGSEKIAKTGAQGETLEEAKKINLSLSTLGNVISNLSGEKDYIPYRDSKLTRILQDSLGGNYKTTLIVACSPHVFNSEESSSTLKFASRAKKIKNKVKQNIKKSTEELERIIEDLSGKLLIAKQEIERLKKRIRELPQTVKMQYKLEEDDEAKIRTQINSVMNLSTKEMGKEIIQTPLGDFTSRSTNSFNFSPPPREIKRNSNKTEKRERRIFEELETEDSKLKLSRLNRNETIKEINEGNSVVSKGSDKKDMNVSVLEDIFTNNNDDRTEANQRRVNYNLNIKNFNRHSTTIVKLKPNFINASSTESDPDPNEPSSKQILVVDASENENPKNHHKSCFSSHPPSSICNANMNIAYKEAILKLQDREILIKKITTENEKLVSSQIFLKEKIIGLKEKINEFQNHKEALVNVEISRVEKLLIKLENASQNIVEEYRKCSQNLADGSIKRLTEENIALRLQMSETEKEYLELFKKIKIIQDENQLQNNLNVQANYQSTIKQLSEKLNLATPEFASYKSLLDINRNYMKDILNFFLSKQDFFNSHIYDSSTNGLRDLERCKSNNYKTGFIKISILSVFYEKMLFNLINKVSFDLRYRETERKLHSDIKLSFDKMLGVLEHYNMFISDFKKLKLEEIVVLSKIDNAIPENQDQAFQVANPNYFACRHISTHSIAGLLQNRPIARESMKTSLNVRPRIPTNMVRKVMKKGTSSKFLNMNDRNFLGSFIDGYQNPVEERGLGFIASTNTNANANTKNKMNKVSFITNTKSGYNEYDNPDKEKTSMFKAFGPSNRHSSYNLNANKLPPHQAKVHQNILILEKNSETLEEENKDEATSMNESSKTDERYQLSSCNHSDEDTYKTNTQCSLKPKNSTTTNCNTNPQDDAQCPAVIISTNENKEDHNTEESKFKAIKANIPSIIKMQSQGVASKSLAIQSEFKLQISPTALSQLKLRNAAERGNNYSGHDHKSVFNSVFLESGIRDNVDWATHKELKELKTEVEMYKAYIQSINNKLQSEQNAFNSYNEILKTNEETNKATFKSELEKLEECFEVYRGFYEDELSVRRDTILRLSSAIDDILLNENKPLLTDPPLKTQNEPNYSINYNSLTPNFSINHNQTVLNNFATIGTNKSPSNKHTNRYKTISENYNNRTICTERNKGFHSKKQSLTEYFFNKKETIMSSTKKEDSNKLLNLFYDASGSATKKMDFVKLAVKENDNNSLVLSFGSGLQSKVKGKSPLQRNFKVSLNGDNCDDICMESLK